VQATLLVLAVVDGMVILWSMPATGTDHCRPADLRLCLLPVASVVGKCRDRVRFWPGPLAFADRNIAAALPYAGAVGMRPSIGAADDEVFVMFLQASSPADSCGGQVYVPLGQRRGSRFWKGLGAVIDAFAGLAMCATVSAWPACLGATCADAA